MMFSVLERTCRHIELIYICHAATQCHIMIAFIATFSKTRETSESLVELNNIHGPLSSCQPSL